MAVSLTISETIDGLEVADALATSGAPATGVDFGSAVNGSYAPLTDSTDNTGRKDLFIRHDAVVDPITDVKFFMQQYGLGTGFSYGGADSAVNDLATMGTLASTSGSSKNNADGLSGGLWIDFNATLQDVANSTQFDYAANGFADWDGSSFTTTTGNNSVAIFRNGGTDAIDLASAFPLKALACVIDTDQSQGGDATNGFIPTAPVEGQIGKNSDTALGDNAHIKLRTYVRSDTVNGGILQWELATSFSFSA